MKKIELLTREEFAVPFRQNGFEVSWSFPFIYPLFYEGQAFMTLPKNEFKKRLHGYLQKILEFHPDYFLVDQWFLFSLFKRSRRISKREMAELWMELTDTLNRAGITTMICCQDDPGVFYSEREVMSVTHRFKIVLTHSLQREFCYRKHGQEVLYFPTFANVDLENEPVVPPQANGQACLPRLDVFFVGGMTMKRKWFFWRLAKRLKPFAYYFGGEPFQYTNQKDFRFDPKNRAQVFQLYRTSRINIVYGSADPLGGWNRSWGVSDRVYHIGACGGFFLSDERRHLADAFTLDPSLYSFRTLNECVEKIYYYLQNDRERASLAEQIHREVMERHTLQQRIRNLVMELTKIGKVKIHA